MNDDVESVYTLIQRLKDVHDEKYAKDTGDCAEILFQHKYCYYFAYMLSKFYPNGKYYIKKKDHDHIAFQIADVLYDSRGIMFDYEDKFMEMEAEDWLYVDLFMVPLNDNYRRRLEELFNSLVDDVKETYYPEIFYKDGVKKK